MPIRLASICATAPAEHAILMPLGGPDVPHFWIPS